MANNINWGKIYESTYWGSGVTDNSINWGKSYADLAGDEVGEIVNAFVLRVETDLGSVESVECLTTSVTYLVSNP
jgi:hypothetical protein